MRIKYFKLFASILLISFLTTSCEKQKITPDVQTTSNYVVEIKSSEEFPSANNYINTQLGINNSSLKLGKLELPFPKGWIDKKSVVAVKDTETGFIKYSYTVKKKKGQQYFYNLVFTDYLNDNISEIVLLKYNLDDQQNELINAKEEIDWEDYRNPVDRVIIFKKSKPSDNKAGDCDPYSPSGGYETDPGGGTDETSSGGGGSTFACGYVFVGYEVQDDPENGCEIVCKGMPIFRFVCVRVTAIADDCPETDESPTGVNAPRDTPSDEDAYLGIVDSKGQDWLNQRGNENHNASVLANIDIYAGDALVEEIIMDHVQRLRIDPEYKDYVEATFGWGPVMWSIAKELIGDKAVDLAFQLIPGFGQADEVRDAFKAAKNGDWLEFIAETGKIVLKETPWGKWVKTLDIADDLFSFYKKVEKIGDKIGSYADDIVEQIWNIASRFPESVKLNPTLLEGLAKAAKRGNNTISGIKYAIPDFSAKTDDALEHIFRGNGSPTGGLHHISGILADPRRKILDIVEPNSTGVYKALVEFEPGQVKWKTFFPDSKSEVGIAKAIENVFNNTTREFDSLKGIWKQSGTDSSGLLIEIITDINGKIKSAYPLRN